MDDIAAINAETMMEIFEGKHMQLRAVLLDLVTAATTMERAVARAEAAQRKFFEVAARARLALRNGDDNGER